MDILDALAIDEAAPESDLTPEEEQALVSQVEQQVRDALSRRLVFLLTGRTGMGKSSTINNLLGQDIAPVGHYEPTTVEVKEYDARIAGIACTVIDTPGLCDDLPEAGKDDEYLALIQEKVREVNCVWFVSRLDETRVTSDEIRGIQMLSTALGPEVWDHALIVFTFAGNVSPHRFREAVDTRTRLIRGVIARYAPKEVAEAIPAVPVDNTREYTPDERQWLGHLYLQVLKRVSRKSAQPFSLAVMGRVVVDDEKHRPPPATYTSSGAGTTIRVSRSEFREALAATWEGVSRLASVSVEKAKAVIKSGWSRVKGWFS
ncbi:MAG TPA: GTPase [Longimicrobium sp.]|nr:GTPase [Longimicrobium sp.]